MIYLFLFFFGSLYIQKMIASLTVAAFFDSVAYVMVSRSNCEILCK